VARARPPTTAEQRPATARTVQGTRGAAAAASGRPVRGAQVRRRGGPRGACSPSARKVALERVPLSAAAVRRRPSLSSCASSSCAAPQAPGAGQCLLLAPRQQQARAPAAPPSSKRAAPSPLHRRPSIRAPPPSSLHCQPPKRPPPLPGASASARWPPLPPLLLLPAAGARCKRASGESAPPPPCCSSEAPSDRGRWMMLRGPASSAAARRCGTARGPNCVCAGRRGRLREPAPRGCERRREAVILLCDGPQLARECVHGGAGRRSRRRLDSSASSRAAPEPERRGAARSGRGGGRPPPRRCRAVPPPGTHAGPRRSGACSGGRMCVWCKRDAPVPAQHSPSPHSPPQAHSRRVCASGPGPP